MGLFVAGPALAHEFWIEPHDFRLSSGETIVADLKVGQHMKGDIFPYLPDRFVEMSRIGPQEKQPIEETLGAIPAITQAVQKPGLYTLIYHSRPSRVAYDSFEKFEEFVDDERLTGVIEAHRRRGLPEVGFIEAFTRSVKALVAVGDGAGQDAATSLPFELVAQSNPYTQADDSLVVQLLWQEHAMADTQIKVFHKTAQGEVTEKRVITDSEGRATISLDQPGIFMLSAAHMTLPSKQVVRETFAVWHSFWTSLTFKWE